MTYKEDTGARTILVGGLGMISVMLVAAAWIVSQAFGAVAEPFDEVVMTSAPTPIPTATIDFVTGDGGGGSGDDIAGQIPPGLGGGDYAAVYFTSPLNPDDGNHTGGLDLTLVDAINASRISVDIAAFEFDLQSVTDALLGAHAAGVQVRVVNDNEHTADTNHIDQLRIAGIPVVDDDRSAFMHNKFIVIDGRDVWTGSMNFTENGVYRNNNNLIRITSPELAANYTIEFEEMFVDNAFGSTSPSNTPENHLITAGGVRIENYFAPEDMVMDRIRAQVARASSSIHFMAFSYTHDDLSAVMLDRAFSGVEVLGIFESRAANTQYSECPIMLTNGLDVRLDGNPYTFHHKVIIIDASVVITGSFNFSANATEVNDENLVVIHDPVVASKYEIEFARRWAETKLPAGGECKAG